MTAAVERARRRIREIVAGSSVPEDARHADNTLEWLLRLAPGADAALELAALGHDIERAIDARKVRRADFADYDAFKAAHAENSARILAELLAQCGVAAWIAREVCRLVRRHETGGDRRSDLLRDADGLSYFDVNLPLYFERHGWDETLRRALWGRRRLSPAAARYLDNMRYGDPVLERLLERARAGV